MKKATILLTLFLAVFSIKAFASAEQFYADELIEKEIFEIVQTKNLDAFSAKCITEEDLKNFIVGLDENSPKEASIKSEFSQMDVKKDREKAVNDFNKLFETFEADKIDLGKAKNDGVVDKKQSFETSKLSCKKVRLKLSFEKFFYLIRFDLFVSAEKYCIYDVYSEKFPKIDFRIASPAGDQITIKQGNGLDIKIEFDAEAANKAGAWIETRFDGKHAGIRTATNMESPYKTEIPAEALKKGSHTVFYRIHPVGEKKYRYLGEAKLDIVVE